MDDTRYIIRDMLVFVFITFAIALLGGCSSSRNISERSVKDSVVYTFKTLYRDSVRIKDSTVIVYSHVQKDSVVLRVDKQTGEVLSKDTWHWKDTGKERDHIADIRNMVDRHDSLSSAEVKSDRETTVRQNDLRPSEAEKTHYWRTWWLGMLAGIGLSVVWKYREKIFVLLAKRLSCLI